MYKSPESRAVKKSEPYAFCRNKKCKLHLVDQSEDGGPVQPIVVPDSESEPAPEPSAEDKPKAGKKKATKKKAIKRQPPQNKPKKPSKAERAAAEKAKKAADKKAKAEAKKAKAKAAKEKAAKKKAAKKKAKAGDEGNGNGSSDGAESSSGSEGRSEEYQKAATRIKEALADDGAFTQKICELAVSMVVNKDSEDAARDLIVEFELEDKFGLKLP
jgi:hypothetical protein